MVLHLSENNGGGKLGDHSTTEYLFSHFQKAGYLMMRILSEIV